MTTAYEWTQDPKVTTHITVHARNLVRDHKIRECDREDFEQECRLQLLSIPGRFDPKRSQPITFASRVIENFTRRYLRDQNAQKRRPPERVYFQSENYEDPETKQIVPVEQLMDNASLQRRTGGRIEGHTESIKNQDLIEHISDRAGEDEYEIVVQVSRSSIKQTAEWRGESRHQTKKSLDNLRRKFRGNEEI